MTHAAPMAESDGGLGESRRAERSCRGCGSENVVVQTWESRCGGFTDYKYTCGDCGKVWWVDGIDS